MPRATRVPTTPQQLRDKILELPERAPIATAFELRLRQSRELSPRSWYRTQKQHWLGWLEAYDGPGSYGRKRWDRSAEYIYNHIVCPPMLLWLAEASGVQTSLLRGSVADAVASGPSLASRAAAIRRKIPWREIRWDLD